MVLDEDNQSEYFRDALNLFYETQWLYRFPVTEILVRNSLDEFPQGWLETLGSLDNDEINELVVNKITKRDWPESLLSFVEKCVTLDKLPRVVESQQTNILPDIFRKGLSDKKQHEILQLANLVQAQCADNGIDTIVDLGSGLGYVCQLLNHLHGYRVLGLESNPKNVEAAKKRQAKFHPGSMSRVRYICANVDVKSASEIEHYLNDSSESTKKLFCLIGLHACGDLGVNACKLFASIPTAKMLVVLSCCYHKLELCDDKHSTNFPVSETLRTLAESSSNDLKAVFQRPFLRLACQEPADRWDKMSKVSHREHSFHVLARAVLELYAQKNSIVLKKLVRKATRKTQCSSFETYLEDALLRYDFSRDGKALDSDSLRKGILSSWLDSLGKLDKAEIYTGLQLMLQSPAESLVLEDRRCWLAEMGFETKIIGVTARTLSPRSHAIVSRKNIDQKFCEKFI